MNSVGWTNDEAVPRVTDRLILREFAVEDATSVQRLAGEWEVAFFMLFVTHSYSVVNDR